jgi:hypothetical protein
LGFLRARAGDQRRDRDAVALDERVVQTPTFVIADVVDLRAERRAEDAAGLGLCVGAEAGGDDLAQLLEATRGHRLGDPVGQLDRPRDSRGIIDE